MNGADVRAIFTIEDEHFSARFIGDRTHGSLA
jgi:hypothetical protein